VRAPSLLLLAASLGTIDAGAAPAVVSFPLGAGTTVALVEDHRVPVVSVVLEFPVGTWSPWAREASAIEAFDLQRFDPDGRLRAEGDRLAADVRVTSDERSVRLSAICLEDDLDEVLSLLRRILTNPDIDTREAKRRKRTRDIEWKTAEKQPNFAAARASARALFSPGDPRRVRTEEPAPTTSDVKRLLAARDTVVRLPGRVLGFAGDVTRAEVERLAAGLLPNAGTSGPENLAPTFLPIVPSEEREDVSVRLPRLTQVYFAFGRESISYTDPDYPAFVLASHVLGGHFYSRLTVALRHEGGETYGAATRNLGDVVVGAYGIGTFTRTANAAATEAKLREVLRSFHEKGITEEERAEAAGHLRGRRALGRQSPGQALWRHLTERRLGLEDGFLDRVPDRASALGLDEVNAFIGRYFDPTRFTLVKVVPEE
jgi:zinc protease